MEKCLKWMLVVLGCFLFSLGGALSIEAATSGSHYPLGCEGVMAATLPPPGVYYRAYTSWYNPTTLKNDNGDEMNVGFNTDAFAIAHRFVWVTKKKILGADYAFDMIVPVVDINVNIKALGVSDSQSLSLGDICIQPLGLGWHGSRWDASLALAVLAPTGEYDSNKPASPGLGYWTGLFTLGGTLYLDQEKSWSISALTRTLVHTEQEDTNVTPGSEFLVEYGLGKQIPVNKKLLVRPGIAGYAYWQIDDDSDDGPGTIADERKKSFALGAEINFLWLPPTNFQLNLRVLREFGAENTTEGSKIVFTLTKGW
ncbi:transporter [Desulfobacula sp.]|uniref:SphA family protein n=1 Tax=Desulfobacula sp. TaxID=2593537 RepID=UPI0026205FC4|nr:transporter [Desulfobacula sp.]